MKEVRTRSDQDLYVLYRRMIVLWSADELAYCPQSSRRRGAHLTSLSSTREGIQSSANPRDSSGGQLRGLYDPNLRTSRDKLELNIDRLRDVAVEHGKLPKYGSIDSNAYGVFHSRLAVVAILISTCIAYPTANANTLVGAPACAKRTLATAHMLSTTFFASLSWGSCGGRYW